MTSVCRHLRAEVLAVPPAVPCDVAEGLAAGFQAVLSGRSFPPRSAPPGWPDPLPLLPPQVRRLLVVSAAETLTVVRGLRGAACRVCAAPAVSGPALVEAASRLAHLRLLSVLGPDLPRRQRFPFGRLPAPEVQLRRLLVRMALDV